MSDIDKLCATEARERLELIIDCCDNLLAALQMRLPDALHKEGLQGGIEEIKRLANHGKP